MLALLPILMLALLDVGDEPRRQATKNELQNRLGLRTEKPRSDLRARILECYRILEGLPPEVGRSLQSLSMSGQAREDDPRRNYADFRWYVLDAIPVVEQNDGWNPTRTRELPPAGQHSEIEAMLPGLARLIVLEWKGFQRGIPPDVFLHECVFARDENDLKGPPLALHTIKQDMASIVDYLLAEEPDLLRFGSIADLLEASEAWHAQFAGSLEYRQKAIPGVTLVRYADGGRIDRLVTAHECESEGATMGHCVGGHWAEVREGNPLFSYRGPDGVPLATVEIDKNRLRIRDAQGPDDKPPGDKIAALRMIRFLERAGIEVDEEQQAYFGVSPPDVAVLPDARIDALDRASSQGDCDALPADADAHVVDEHALLQATCNAHFAYLHWQGTEESLNNLWRSSSGGNRWKTEAEKEAFLDDLGIDRDWLAEYLEDASLAESYRKIETYLIEEDSDAATQMWQALDTEMDAVADDRGIRISWPVLLSSYPHRSTGGSHRWIGNQDHEEERGSMHVEPEHHQSNAPVFRIQRAGEQDPNRGPWSGGAIYRPKDGSLVHALIAAGVLVKESVFARERAKKEAADAPTSTIGLPSDVLLSPSIPVFLAAAVAKGHIPSRDEEKTAERLRS